MMLVLDSTGGGVVSTGSLVVGVKSPASEVGVETGGSVDDAWSLSLSLPPVPRMRLLTASPMSCLALRWSGRTRGPRPTARLCAACGCSAVAATESRAMASSEALNAFIVDGILNVCEM
jgi:hypothetical protein